MKIYASKPLPPADELVKILNKEFSPRYSSKLFGLGKEKTIMVKASTLVGTQISIRNNEITVQGTVSPIIPVIAMTELVAIFVLFLGWFSREPWKKLEREVAVFLQQRYN